MAGLMIFLPNYEGEDAKELAARGASELLEPGITPIFTPVRNGPSGAPGKLVTFYPGHTPREYDAAAQTWMEAPPAKGLERGRYWLGYVTNEPPTPEELQRPTLIDGEPVVLADDKVWVIPVADFCPKRLTFDPTTGTEVSVPEVRHQHFVNLANEIFKLFVSDGFAAAVARDRAVRIPGGLMFAGVALSKNYRLNSVAVDLLQLVGEYQAFDVARVATGMATMERILAQKKSSA